MERERAHLPWFCYIIKNEGRHRDETRDETQGSSSSSSSSHLDCHGPIFGGGLSWSLRNVMSCPMGMKRNPAIIFFQHGLQPGMACDGRAPPPPQEALVVGVCLGMKEEQDFLPYCQEQDSLMNHIRVYHNMKQTWSCPWSLCLTYPFVPLYLCTFVPLYLWCCRL